MAGKKANTAKVKNLSDDDHVARNCNKQSIIRDPITKAVMGLHPSAMKLRSDLNETYLSSTWVEYHQGNYQTRLKSVLKGFRGKKLARSPDAGLGVFNVGAILAAGVDRGRELRVFAKDRIKNPSYIAISGLPLDNSDLTLTAMLIKQCSTALHLVSEIDSWP